MEECATQLPATVPYFSTLQLASIQAYLPLPNPCLLLGLVSDYMQNMWALLLYIVQLLLSFTGI